MTINKAAASIAVRALEQMLEGIEKIDPIQSKRFRADGRELWNSLSASQREILTGGAMALIEGISLGEVHVLVKPSNGTSVGAAYANRAMAALMPAVAILTATLAFREEAQ